MSSSPQQTGGNSSADDDLYRILNVRHDASALELKAAYRQLSQRFHPDKHIEEDAKATATDQFTRVKEAYEILSNEKLRRIYNEFGLDAARSASTPELELVPYADLAQRFKSEAWENRGHGPGGNESGRDAYFTVTNSFEPRVDASGLFVALEDGGDILTHGGPLAIITQVGLASNATAYVSQRNTLGFRYSLSGYDTQARGNGGVGDVELSLRHQLDAYSHIETSVQAPLDEGLLSSVGLKAFRALSKDMSMSWEATLNPQRGNLTTAISAARSFNERNSASVSWAVGSRNGYAFTWSRSAYDEYVAEEKSSNEFEFDDDLEIRREDGFFKWFWQKAHRLLQPTGLRWTARVSAMDASLSFVARRPIGDEAPLWQQCKAIGSGGTHVKLSGVLGLLGWEIKAGIGRRFMLADTEIGTNIGFGTMGIIWRIKARRGGHRLNIPIVLQSGYLDTKTALLGSLFWSVTLSTLQLLVIQPWEDWVEKEERSEARARRLDDLQQTRMEADAVKQLMKIQVEQIIEAEENVEIDGKKGCGLLIKRGVYGWRRNVRKLRFSDPPLDGREIETEMVDVGVALQALVDRSAIQIVSATKSTISGVWDPSAHGDKDELVLRIWYFFQGQKHECLLKDDEPIELPLSSHRTSKWS